MKRAISEVYEELKEKAKVGLNTKVKKNKSNATKQDNMKK